MLAPINPLVRGLTPKSSPDFDAQNKPLSEGPEPGRIIRKADKRRWVSVGVWLTPPRNQAGAGHHRKPPDFSILKSRSMSVIAIYRQLRICPR
jgi:hypothetical protein